MAEGLPSNIRPDSGLVEQILGRLFGWSIVTDCRYAGFSVDGTFMPV